MLGLPERKPMPQLVLCGHCQQLAVGRGSYNGVRLCQPSQEQVTEGSMDCYRLVSISHHELPCSWCQSGLDYGGSHGH